MKNRVFVARSSRHYNEETKASFPREIFVFEIFGVLDFNILLTLNAEASFVGNRSVEELSNREIVEKFLGNQYICVN